MVIRFCFFIFSLETEFFCSFTVEYKTIICILVLADVDVNACIKSSENFVHEANCNYLPDVTFLFYSFSLNDGIDFLMNAEDSSDEDNHDLAMLPPIEKANAEIHMGSGASDDMSDDFVHHLPRHLLNSTCDSSLLDEGNKQKFVLRTQSPNKKSRKSAARNWKKDTDLQPTLKLSEASAVLEEWKEIIKSPIDVFKAMFSDDLDLHATN